MREIAYSKQAVRTLRRLPERERARIVARIEDVAAGRRADVKPLKGRPGLRLRVGDWRVILGEDGAVLAVLKIGSRGDVY